MSEIQAGNQGIKPKTRALNPSRNPIHRLRLENLKLLLKERYAGKAAHMAKAIERSHTFLWQLLNSYRAIGEDSARMIEQKLGLGLGTLDKGGGRAFQRNLVLVAQMGDGYSKQIVMIPLLEIGDTVLPDRARRAAMSKAKDHVPCHLGCTEEAYAINVDFSAMEPRLRQGDKAIIEPSKTTLEHDKVYWLRPKGGGKPPIMRVAVKKDTGRFIFTLPPENRKNGSPDKPLTPDEVIVLGRVLFMVRDI